MSYLVINGDESEPATFKDHLLIERDPHQLIEGGDYRGVGAPGLAVFIYLPRRVRARDRAAQTALQRRLRARRDRRGHLRLGVLLDLVVHPGAGAYICGDETALFESLEGKRGFPRIKPPFFPAAIGLYGSPRWSTTSRRCPTPLDRTNGGPPSPRWEGRSTGTRLFGLAGHVQNPGVTRSRW